jgi:hypothetical protein
MSGRTLLNTTRLLVKQVNGQCYVALTCWRPFTLADILLYEAENLMRDIYRPLARTLLRAPPPPPMRGLEKQSRTDRLWLPRNAPPHRPALSPFVQSPAKNLPLLIGGGFAAPLPVMLSD